MALIARLLLFAGIVVISAAIGATAMFFGTFFIATLFGASNINGGLAMGAAGLMPLGGLIGAGLGAWFAWRVVTRSSARAAMAGGYGLLAFAVIAVGGWFGYREMTDGDPYEASAEPTVHVEWRLPEKVADEDVKRTYRYTMRSTFRDWTLSSSWDIPPFRQEDAHTVLRFRGTIRWRADGRIFQLWTFPNHDDRITVDLNLGDDPAHSRDYGEWRDVPAAPGHAFRTRVARE